jgi:hypothetical protein
MSNTWRPLFAGEEVGEGLGTDRAADRESARGVEVTDAAGRRR